MGYSSDKVDAPLAALARKVLAVAAALPSAPALTVDSECWTYRDLLGAAGWLALRLPVGVPGRQAPVTAVLASRSASAYLGILASLLAGNTYVPLGRSLPASHNLQVLLRSGARRIICGRDSARYLQEVLALVPKNSEPPEVLMINETRDGFPVLLGNDLPIGLASPEQVAYILFTSGSTGTPKGVAISHANLCAYLEAVGGVLHLGPGDRHSQTFELTFDLSVHDLLVTWTSGAHLMVLRQTDLARPAEFISTNRLTSWFSVPTLAHQIDRQGELIPGAFPSLRWSLFCGEALPMTLARRWLDAAPSSHVENWYGPTEATIACARFNLDNQRGLDAGQDGVAPIGRPFEGMAMAVVDESLKKLPIGEVGELVLSGSQVACGYLEDAERTAVSFVRTGLSGAPWYRTGDLARVGEGGVFEFLGRLDQQVKIRGYRIELGAVEACLRAAVPTAHVVALAWPPSPAMAQAIVAAVEGSGVKVDRMLEHARGELPGYMVPARIVAIEHFPTNASGKTDRRAIVRLVEQALAVESRQTPRMSTVGQRLMDAILAVSPHLDPAVVQDAEDLLAAGMDSLGLIALSTALEQSFALHLSPETVAWLAESSFGELEEKLRAKEAGGSEPSFEPRQRSSMSPSKPGSGLSRRANRVLQFIGNFRRSVDAAESPLIVALGSSGIFRGFDPGSFRAALLAGGHEGTPLNVGLPAIDVRSLARVAKFIADTLRDAQRRLHLAIYELDPMLLSIIPPASDLQLQDWHFETSAPVLSDVGDDFQWVVERGGAPPEGFGLTREPSARGERPLWQVRREREVALTYAGLIEFDTAALAAWKAGLACLSEVAEHVVVFIHPLDRARLPAMDGLESTATRWQAMLSEVRKVAGAKIVDWECFQLDSTDFVDLNHVRGGPACRKLTEQLAGHAIKILGAASERH